jgi:hypothetical protein
MMKAEIKIFYVVSEEKNIISSLERVVVYAEKGLQKDFLNKPELLMKLI